MDKEIKKESDFWGNEKWVIYEDGNRVGETKKETDFWGNAKQVTYNTNGEKVSETKPETGLFGGEKYVTYDTSGNKLSETKYEQGLFGDPKEVIYKDNSKIGEMERSEGLLDILTGTQKKKLKESYDDDIDLTTRNFREKSPPNQSSYYSSGYDSSYGASFNSVYSGNSVRSIPDEIKGWNWGAFFLTFIWGIGNGVWISLLALIPYVGLIMCFVLGAKGNEWAWKNSQATNIKDFKKNQRIWSYFGIGIGGLNLLFVLILIIAAAKAGYR